MARPTESRWGAGTSRQDVTARAGEPVPPTTPARTPTPVLPGTAAPQRPATGLDDDRIGSSSGGRDDRPGRSRAARAVIGAFCVLIFAMAAGVSIGPASIPLSQVAGSLIAHLPWHPATGVPRIDSAIVWQIRFPRVVLGALVGAMLAGGGAAYQGVFRNPLADPYLLGIAAGAGLGATMVIISGGSPSLLPVAAFGGGAAAVALTYSLGAASGQRGQGDGRSASTPSILLAGVAVAALLTAAQTFLQQAHSQSLQQIYGWILGGLSGATWSQVWLIVPYVVVSAVALLAHRRLLDVLRVGETEAGTLGINVSRLRLIVVIAATLGTAAAVSVSGLIGFVGIIVPHAVRLTAGPTYRIVLPVSMIGGAAFLVLADIAARTIQPDTEVPIGVITAAVGAPFFLFVLRSRRARQEVA
jgi:iron complex transport system permease protein